ncbi:LbetaH domain-containing protein [Desulfogranum japonicum]|uniref:bifunctional GlmU protein n=1 Tax=Desulfogranum japonicum TaxID=231447 RepID=UPI00048DCD0C|nr:bifunctional GlmU protein [Desulfogranum japonicum]
MLNPESFFDLSEFSQREIFNDCTYVWDVLKKLKSYTQEKASPFLIHRCLSDGVPLTSPFIVHNGRLRNARECTITYGDATKGTLHVCENGQILEGASIIMAGATLIGQNINIGRGVLIESGAYIKGPTIIDDQAEIRQGAYIRGHCIIGKRCVVGHATEVKHSIFLNDAKAGHFAYLGDTILGNQVNLGAGTKCANFRFIPGNVEIKTSNGTIKTDLRKFGAIMGDECQTGCNSVTSPGAVFGPSCILMPTTTAASGHYQARTVIRP